MARLCHKGSVVITMPTRRTTQIRWFVRDLETGRADVVWAESARGARSAAARLFGCEVDWIEVAPAPERRARAA